MSRFTTPVLVAVALAGVLIAVGDAGSARSPSPSCMGGKTRGRTQIGMILESTQPAFVDRSEVSAVKGQSLYKADWICTIKQGQSPGFVAFGVDKYKGGYRVTCSTGGAPALAQVYPPRLPRVDAAFVLGQPGCITVPPATVAVPNATLQVGTDPRFVIAILPAQRQTVIKVVSGSLVVRGSARPSRGVRVTAGEQIAVAGGGRPVKGAGTLGQVQPLRLLPSDKATLAKLSAATTKSKEACGAVTIGVTGPFTGPAASIGADQLAWAKLFIDYWNSGKPITGTPANLQRVKLKAIYADTRSDPSAAAAVAKQLASNPAVMLVDGFSNTRESLDGGLILRGSGLAFVSGHATGAELTDPSAYGTQLAGYFHRVVPNDDKETDIDVSFLERKLGIHSGDTVMAAFESDGSSDSLMDRIRTLLLRNKIRVDFEGQGVGSDWTFLANQAKKENAAAVVFASQDAAGAQLFLKTLRQVGFAGRWLSTSGTFDQKTFTVPKAFVSSFTPDIHTIKSAAPIEAAFEKTSGHDTTSVGVPTWIAVQTMAHAISAACARGKLTRMTARLALDKVSLKTSIIGRPIAFQPNGDVKGGTNFTIFQIQTNASYQVVQAG